LKAWLIPLLFLFVLPAPILAGPIQVGQPLPEITIQKKGMMVPDYEVKEGRMIFKKGGSINYQAWHSKEMTGRVRTVYHLAARDGMDEINASYIDALVAESLPETLPDAPYKTITILNLDDALWGTRGIAKMRLEKSQKEFPYARYVADEKGTAMEAWGLKKKESAVIVLSPEDRVLFFKEGKMTSEEIATAVRLIKKELGLP
jgi:YtfJ family uncharacterized protein